MCSLYENDQAVDPITVADMLQKSSEQFLDKAQQRTYQDKDLMEIVGGMDFLIDLAGMMGTAANVVYHAGIVHEKAVLRSLISVSNTIAAEAFEGADEAGTILDRAQGRIYDISEDTRVGGFAAVDQIVPGTFKSIEEAFQNNDEVTGLRTGFSELDRRTGGLQKSDLVVLAARPSMGKTSSGLEPGLQRGRQRERGRGHLQPGNGARAAGDAHARQQRLVQPAQPAPGQAAGRGLAAADPGLRAADPGAHLHRRQQRHLGPGNEGQGAAAQAAAWPRA